MIPTRAVALLVALTASSCCTLVEEGCDDSLTVTATVPRDDVLTAEFCFRDLCDSVPLPAETQVRLFIGADAPYTWLSRSGESLEVVVTFNVSPVVTEGMNGDAVRLRVYDADGNLALDESRTVDYVPPPGATCGGCYHAEVAI